MGLGPRLSSVPLREDVSETLSSQDLLSPSWGQEDAQVSVGLQSQGSHPLGIFDRIFREGTPDPSLRAPPEAATMLPEASV